MAKRFNFRLNPVLNLKIHKASIAKDELGNVIRLKIKKEKQINEHKEYRESLNTEYSGSVTASELQAEVHHKDYIEEEIKNLEHEKKQIVEIESLKRIKLTEAMKEEKTLVKLKEKKKIEYDAEIKDEEKKALDEIGLRRHNKSN